MVRCVHPTTITQTRSQSGRPGFTLVELLVVIGIIALLIGILLPSLNKARQASVSAACKSNLHQYVLAAEMYNSDYRGFQVDAYKIFNVPTGLVRYMGKSQALAKVARCPGDNQPDDSIRLGPLGLNTTMYGGGSPTITDGRYVSNVADYLMLDEKDQPIPVRASYGANENALSSTHRGTSGGEGVFWIRKTILGAGGTINPTKTMVFGDWQNNQRASATASETLATALKGPIIQPGSYTGVMGSIAFRHSGNICNAAFLDGHVGELRTNLKTINGGIDLQPGQYWGQARGVQVTAQLFKTYYPFGPGAAGAVNKYVVNGDMPNIDIH